MTETESVGHILDDFSCGEILWGVVVDGEQVLDQDSLRELIDSCLETLTPKQRQVIEKVLANKKLSETERKMKIRVFDRIRREHPEFEDLL